MNITDALGTDIAHRGDFLRTSGGDLQTIEGLANLKQALFHRLVTVPGSLAHRPTYGVGLPMYQNGLSSFGIQQKLAARIREQFAEDPRVEEVSSISINSTDADPSLTILAVSVKVIGYSDPVDMKFTPFGGGLS